MKEKMKTLLSTWGASVFFLLFAFGIGFSLASLVVDNDYFTISNLLRVWLPITNIFFIVWLILERKIAKKEKN